MSEIYQMIAAGYEQLATAFRALATESGTEKADTPLQEVVADQVTQEVAEKITFEDLKDFLGNLSLNGKRKEVKDLLLKYDSGKLSGVKEEDYPALMADARAL